MKYCEKECLVDLSRLLEIKYLPWPFDTHSTNNHNTYHYFCPINNLNCYYIGKRRLGNHIKRNSTLLQYPPSAQIY